MRIKLTHDEPYANTALSLRRAADEAPVVIADDQQFLISHMTAKGMDGPAVMKSGLKSSGAIKSKKLAKERAEAEEATAIAQRHRIEDNARRYPEIFEKLRTEEFLTWYEQAAEEPWNSRYEVDIDEVRFRILLATERDECK